MQDISQKLGIRQPSVVSMVKTIWATLCIKVIKGVWSTMGYRSRSSIEHIYHPSVF